MTVHSLEPRQLMSGDDAVALACIHAGVCLGTGYPGTPSTEILETFNQLGGKAQWAPNEKVALEVGLGVAFAGARAIVTMKHVGLNVAADPLFTAAYTDIDGGLVIVSADDPGMASSQNEQDNRYYARAAGVPMLEPTDAQQAYDYTLLAFWVAERWKIPVLLRLTTRVCHAKTVVKPRPSSAIAPVSASFRRDIPARVMIPAYAKPAHRRLRDKLAAIAAWNDAEGPVEDSGGSANCGIIATGVAAMHAREAAPTVRHLTVGMTYPLPLQRIREFASEVKQLVVVEEGEPLLYEALRAAGLPVIGKPDRYRFGELDVARVRRLLAQNNSPEPVPAKGKPPELCPGCAHRTVFQALHDLDCIVAGDIGCYTLGVLPPFSAMDTCVCMGASVGVGLGLRHALPKSQARRVVSVIGDSTFVHSGLTGLAEMAYNPPPTGHLLLILDNGTTAMTGQQEHPGTGRTLNHAATHRLDFFKVCQALGIHNVQLFSANDREVDLKTIIADQLTRSETAVFIIQQPCVLAAPKIRLYEQAAVNETVAKESCSATESCAIAASSQLFQLFNE
ncbi:thiamine pyrophosphate-binding protein [Rhodopseudomonas palustris]|uniref:Indolepyruvate oxidoreductase subunit IorA n=1 Tax=Thiospirillum jenense TaxID=1653858 RepID=A0A839H574_9GAMM|nr:thiamine pyrophosphate-dependent enzyme [Thiospirillum jenense]MBB1089684.1 thiamine pyrophosphate-binding protein [Rhodopseudomonas palustris]MBB1124784.1 thiamine pyrophosphate-binding protein [Thiospirillum jenense]